MSAVERWVRHARRFGTEEVYETAAPELTAPERTRLARQLRELDPEWAPGDGPTEVHSCSWCGEPLTGRIDRRTCSGACRVAQHRSDAQAAMRSPRQGVTTDPGAKRYIGGRG